MCALCTTLVNAQTDMTAEGLKAAMTGNVYFNNNLDTPVAVTAAGQYNCFWETNYNGYGPFLENCLSVSYEGNGKYATTYNNQYNDFLGLAITFTVENEVITQFEVTSTCNSERIPVGVYTPFDPNLGTLSSGCTAHTHFVYLGGNTFVRFRSGTTTVDENMSSGFPIFCKDYLIEECYTYVPEDLTLTQYKVYYAGELSFEEMDELYNQGLFCDFKLYECPDVTFTPAQAPGPDLDPDAEYVVVTYKEGSETKKAYYKTSDVETIEWLKGSDVTE